MSKYLKLFNQDAEYQQFKETEEFILPNVSFVESDNVVYYNPLAEAKSGVIMAHYNATEENKLAIVDTSNVKSLKVNGVEVEFSDTYYFSEVGEYDVEIELIDSTLINGMILDDSGQIPISNPMFCNALEMVGACLTSIVIPDSVTSIGNYAFAFCSSLTGKLIIPDSVTEIGIGAFASCSGLTDVHVPDSVTSIGDGAFVACSGLTSVNIGSGVTSIGDDAFCDCFGLTSVNIPDSVTYIGKQAFGYCESLTSIVIPDSVTSIGDSAFYYCLGLATVNIGSGVTSIEDSVFYHCENLTSITCFAQTAPSIQSITFYAVKKGGVLKVPAGSDYSSWMSTDNYYLGFYNWTVEYI